MARPAMVSRTITITSAEVMCLDITTGTPCLRVVILPREFKDDKKLLQEVEKIVNSDILKAVHITSKTTNETLYGMSEADFIEHAMKLDPVTRKPL